MSKKKWGPHLSGLLFDKHSRIYDILADTINGVPVDKLESRLLSNLKLPKGYRARCELHDINFKTLDAMQAHNRELHNYINSRKK